MPNVTVAVTGGGTGGHVYPALTIAEALVALAPAKGYMSAEVHFVGTRGGMEERILARTQIPFHPISAGALRGRAVQETALNLGRMAAGLRHARGLFARHRIQAVLATGGYVCVPVVLAATSRGIPVVIYLPDVTPGWAIRSLAPFASAVAVTNAEAARWFPARKTIVTGYPVREEIFRTTREEALGRLGLGSELPVLLVSGGSRGARSINLAIAHGLPRLLQVCQVVHVTGDVSAQETAELANVPLEHSHRYHPYTYLDEEYPAALVAASLVICRAGASVLGELPAAGLPAILVPYPYAGAHQDENARVLQVAGAARVLANGEAEDALVPLAVDLLSSPDRLAKLREAAKSLAKPDAAREVANVLLELVAHNERRVA